MNLDDGWKKSLKETEIIRSRVKPLHTFEATQLPYVFLAASKVNPGDTVVRKGEVMISQPSVILPKDSAQFEGFKFEEDFPAGASLLNSFLFVRGVRFPSYKYNNKTESLDVFEGDLGQAIAQYQNDLQKREDLHTGLIKGPEDCWQFSLLIFVASLMSRQMDSDIGRLFDR